MFKKVKKKKKITFALIDQYEKLLLNEKYFTMHKCQSITQNKRLKAAKLWYSQTTPYVSSHTTANQQNRIPHNVHSVLFNKFHIPTDLKRENETPI